MLPAIDSEALSVFTEVRRGQHEQGAGAPRSGDATGGECCRRPTERRYASARRFGGSGVMGLGMQIGDEHDGYDDDDEDEDDDKKKVDDGDEDDEEDEDDDDDEDEDTLQVRPGAVIRPRAVILSPSTSLRVNSAKDLPT
jgi:hypothetical protein